MLSIVLSLLVLLGLVGLILAVRYVKRARATAHLPLADRLDGILPQTQCGQCGFPSCRPYAEALAAGDADINQCPPGGDAGIRSLARTLGRPIKPLDTSHGIHKPRSIARIEEAACIGCTLCIQACPVDAIVGAAKRMHTVIASECTGCELCLPPCPVDCIDLVAAADAWKWPFLESPGTQTRRRANHSRQRFEARQHRLAIEKQAREERLSRKRLESPSISGSVNPKQRAIKASIERAKAKKAALRKSAHTKSQTGA